LGSAKEMLEEERLEKGEKSAQRLSTKSAGTKRKDGKENNEMAPPAK
jgi:hypothetical protein